MGVTTILDAPPHPRLDGLSNPTRLQPDAEWGVLLLHGFTGTPWELTSTAEPLTAAGASVLAPALPGHGTHPRDLANVRWRHWWNAARQAYLDLRRRHSRVAVVGLSMGAALARLLLNEKSPPDRLVLMAIPHRIVDPVGRWVLPVVRPNPLRHLALWIKEGGSDIAETGRPEFPVNYQWTPLAAVAELDAMLRYLRRHPRPASCPTLMPHGRQDHTAPLAGAQAVRRVLGRQARLLILPQSYHVLPRDVERGRLAGVVRDFCLGDQPWELSLPADWTLAAPNESSFG